MVVVRRRSKAKIAGREYQRTPKNSSIIITAGGGMERSNESGFNSLPKLDNSLG